MSVLPMNEIFMECVAVLDELKRPMHYVDLTAAAFIRMGLRRNSVEWSKQIEDVREKFLEAQQYECFYVPAPHCLGARKFWFQEEQTRLNTEGVSIVSSLQASVAGAVEALMRDKHMLKKNAHASDETVAEARGRGLILQHHVTEWFQEQWPAFFRSPDNDKQWDRVSNHDFGLETGRQTLRIDVVGPSETRGWDPPARKPKTDIHLLCEMLEQQNVVVWCGVVRGTDYEGKILPLYTISPLRMVVWLNCMKHKVDYESCRKAAQPKKRRKR